MDVQQEIRKFIILQRSLLELLGTGRDNVPLSLHVGTLPPTGSVQLDPENWAYRRHGSGVSFKCASGGIVDAHKMIDEPEVFDAWRLRTYFGSLGGRGVKLIARAVGERGLSMDKGIDRLLTTMVESGDVVEHNGYYRLASGS